jgi:hypothetical protein
MLDFNPKNSQIDLKWVLGAIFFMLHANFQDLRFKNEEKIGQIGIQPFDVKNKYSK